MRILSLSCHLAVLLVASSLVGCAVGNALPRGSEEDFKTYQGLGHYKAFAVTTSKGSAFARAWGWTNNQLSVSAAMNQALSSCQKGSKKYSSAPDCRIHSLGNVAVYGMSEDELDYVINQYASDFDIGNDDLDLSKVNR